VQDGRRMWFRYERSPSKRVRILCPLFRLFLGEQKWTRRIKGTHTFTSHNLINDSIRYPSASNLIAFRIHHLSQRDPFGRGLFRLSPHPPVANCSFHFSFYRGLLIFGPAGAFQWPFRPWLTANFQPQKQPASKKFRRTPVLRSLGVVEGWLREENRLNWNR